MKVYKTPDYASNDQDRRVYTDEYLTKLSVHMTWESFLETWRIYMVRKAYGKSIEKYRIGVITNLEMLIHELKIFIVDFEKEMEEKDYDIKRFYSIADIPTDENKFMSYEDSDIYFLWDFFNGFMKISGWKNITRKGEDKSPAVVKRYNEG